MFVSYDGIVFKMMVVEEWSVECIYDRSFTDHIYNQYTITCVCVLNRDLNDSSRFPGPVTAGLQRINNNLPPVGPAGTVPHLVERLSTPRKILQIYSYTDPDDGGKKQMMLECPKPGLRSDCLNGPHCTVLQVMPIGGFSSYAARMQFTASVPLCEGENAPVLISNRWQMSVGLQDDYFAVRSFEGIAHFRLDQLALQNLNPKDYQSYFFFPVEPGFRRVQPNVTRNPAGDQVSYNWTDLETPYSFPGGVKYHATRAEVMEYRSYMRPGSSIRNALDSLSSSSGFSAQGVVEMGNKKVGVS